MSTTASKESVKALLDGQSDIEVRELCIKALRQWHSRRPADDQFDMHGTLGVELVPLLAARKGLSAGDVNTLKETYVDATNEPWMGGIVESQVGSRGRALRGRSVPPSTGSPSRCV